MFVVGRGLLWVLKRNRVKIMRTAKEFSNKCISGIPVSSWRLTCPLTPKLPGQWGVCAVSFDRMKNTHSVKTKEYSLRKNSCYSTCHNMQLSSWVKTQSSFPCLPAGLSALPPSHHCCVGFFSILPVQGVGSIHTALRQHQESSQRSLLATVWWASMRPLTFFVGGSPSH